MAVGSPIDFPSNAMAMGFTPSIHSVIQDAIADLSCSSPPEECSTQGPAYGTGLHDFFWEQEASHHPNGVGWIKHWKNPSCLHSLFMFIFCQAARVYLSLLEYSEAEAYCRPQPAKLNQEPLSECLAETLFYHLQKSSRRRLRTTGGRSWNHLSIRSADATWIKCHPPRISGSAKMLSFSGGLSLIGWTPGSNSLKRGAQSCQQIWRYMLLQN